MDEIEEGHTCEVLVDRSNVGREGYAWGTVMVPCGAPAVTVDGAGHFQCREHWLADFEARGGVGA